MNITEHPPVYKVTFELPLVDITHHTIGEDVDDARTNAIETVTQVLGIREDVFVELFRAATYERVTGTEQKEALDAIDTEQLDEDGFGVV